MTCRELTSSAYAYSRIVRRRGLRTFRCWSGEEVEEVVWIEGEGVDERK